MKSKTDDNHAVVLVNMSENYVSLIDPEDGKLVDIDKTKFLELWNKRESIAGYIKKV